jgi:iron(III) transport system ATP-binding protein
MPDSNPLEMNGLGHAYGDTPVLQDIDLKVGSGEFVALLGPSGCGKTTLLRAVAGLVTPTEGSISIDGVLVTTSGSARIPAEHRGVGLVFQEYALFPHMDVATNVAYGLQSPQPARVSGLLELVGMSEFSDRRPAQLSGGQQQRVALARALAPRPALLLVDEPFANVDAALRETLGRMLKRVVRDEGASVLMVTHDQGSALSLADRVIVMEPGDGGGHIVQDASPFHIYQQPVSEAVARLTGQCAFLDGLATGERATTVIGEAALMKSAEGKVRLVVRPEQLSFTPDPDGQAEVQDLQFSDGTHRIRCSGPTGTWDALMKDTGPPPVVGTTGHIEFNGALWPLP